MEIAAALFAAQRQIQLSPSLSINYVDLGEGTPIIFLHNSGGFWQIWQKQLLYFSKNYRVLAIDLPSNGQSTYVQEEINLSYFTSVLFSFVQKLQLPPFHLVGNCIGSSISINYSQQHPQQVQSLALFNICPGNRLGKNFWGRHFIYALEKYQWMRQLSYPFLRYMREQSAYRDQFPAVLFGPKFPKQDPLFLALEQHFASFDGKKDRFKDLYALNSFSLGRFFNGVISPPFQIFWGEHNAVAKAALDGQFFADQLGGKLCIIPQAGHLCMYENASFCNQKLSSFLKSNIKH